MKSNIRLSKLGGVVVLYLLWGFVGTIYAGFRENYYLTNVRNIPQEQQTYPLELVIWISGFMLVHSIILWLFAKKFAQYPWLSTLAAIAVTLGFIFLVLLGAMHSPPVWGFFGLWEFGLLFLVILLSILGFSLRFLKEK